MAAHLEEQQELDDFKYFWKNWGRWLFALLIAAALGYLGYIIYKDHKINQNREAAEVLAQMVDKAQSKADSKQINADLLKLQQDYSDTVPAAQATMMVAATEFDAGRYDTAAGHLNWVLSNQKAPLVQAFGYCFVAAEKIRCRDRSIEHQSRSRFRAAAVGSERRCLCRAKQNQRSRAKLSAGFGKAA